tara:strand:+ start:825 stop:1142 length:318 start_codon:yes stop_codon:yes gene_type:complete
MDNLDKRIILYLGRTPNFETEVILQDDGSGPYIKEWNITSEKAKPTDSQLNALASDAVKLNNNEIVKATRKKSYGDIGEQLDEIYKDIDAWKARIKKIKDDNPKE